MGLETAFQFVAVISSMQKHTQKNNTGKFAEELANTRHTFFSLFFIAPLLLHTQVLQHRMSVCKVPQWSRVGRLKRKDMPRGRSVGHLLCAGRPVCDVKITAKELIRAKSYDLSELANHVLRTPHQPMEHEDILRAFRYASFWRRL